MSRAARFKGVARCGIDRLQCITNGCAGTPGNLPVGIVCLPEVETAVNVPPIGLMDLPHARVLTGQLAMRPGESLWVFQSGPSLS